MENGAVPSIFENFLSKVSWEIDGYLYVIIDEYDHFANELLSFKMEMFSDIISKTGFVRKWYEVLEKGTESIIKRIFATGVSPITLDSLTSGFNIASDYGKLGSLVDLKNKSQNASVLRDILEGKTIRCRITEGLYFDYFSKKLSESINYEIDVTEIEDAVTEVAFYLTSKKF